jgi:hypothetical protein
MKDLDFGSTETLVQESKLTRCRRVIDPELEDSRGAGCLGLDLGRIVGGFDYRRIERLEGRFSAAFEHLYALPDRFVLRHLGMNVPHFFHRRESINGEDAFLKNTILQECEE